MYYRISQYIPRKEVITMAKAEPIMKGGKQVATKIGDMIVKGLGGLGKSGYIGQIKKGK
jgi:hypothetical protein